MRASRRRNKLLREFPELRRKTLIVEDLHGGRFEQEPGTEGVWFERVAVDGVDFSQADLAMFSARGSEFLGCDFSRARLKDNVTMSYSPQSVFRDCVFDGADMVGPRPGMFLLGVARFERCSFRRTRISSWLSFSAEFVDCRFEGKVRSCNFWGRTPPGQGGGHHTPRAPVNEFRGNDFSRADLDGCAFAGGIDMRLQRWPADEDYVWIDEVLRSFERARDTVRSRVADEEQQRLALIDLDVFEPKGQERTYVRRTDLESDLAEETVEILIAALRGPG